MDMSFKKLANDRDGPVEGTVMSVDFGNGTMQANFQDFGKVPVDRDSLVRLGTTASTVPLSIFADILSGPVDLEGSRPTMRSKTSASLPCCYRAQFNFLLLGAGTLDQLFLLRAMSTLPSAG